MMFTVSKEFFYVPFTRSGSRITQDPVTGVIKVSKHPHGIVASLDKSRLYVSSEEEDVLDVVDLATSKVIRRVPLGRRPNNLAITPDGRRVYVCIRGESRVDIVDTASLKKVKSVPVGRAPHNVYCSPDGRWMIVTSMDDNKLTAIDIKTETPAFEIPLPGQPRPLVIDPDIAPPLRATVGPSRVCRRGPRLAQGDRQGLAARCASGSQTADPEDVLARDRDRAGREDVMGHQPARQFGLGVLSARPEAAREPLASARRRIG